MRSPSRLLISLCFAGLSVSGFIHKPALAEEVLGPADAAAHLARADAVASRCGHLTAQLRDELSGYSSMAEVVVAGQLGSDEVTRVMNDARKQAGGMTCGVETEDLALSAIEAARDAMNQAGDTSPSMRPTIAEVPAIQVEQEAANVVAVSIPDDAEIKVEPAVKPRTERKKKTTSGELQTYVHATAAYYLERRCQHLDHASATRFWRKIVTKHDAALSSHDRTAVASAKARAISMARSAGACGARTARLVRAGMNLVARN
ncbi:MAG: hypothetical protein R3287_09980 [Anderseniella sp.]|nr:hypothetical protein [Anderseniella sp.]